MRSLLIISVFILSVMTGGANNIKIDSEARVTGFTGAAQDTALVEFTVSWDNSWRDDFNWDAAWIFLKYKKRGATAEWQHAYLTREGHTATALPGNEGSDHTFMFGEIGSGENARVTGLYLMRDGISEGKVSTRLTLKWPLQSNNRQPLTAADFGTDRDSIYVAAYAVEMVYVPYGSYTAGDEHSNFSFSFKGIPENADVVNLTSGYEITTNNQYGSYYATNAANHVDESRYGTNSSWEAYNNPPYWWMIDFKTEKTIRYFGVSGATTHPGLAPLGTWYLQGSHDGVNFEDLAGVSEKEWCAKYISYPVQCRFKVPVPKPYRYYRINMPVVHNNLVVQNIAMTEKELEGLGNGLLVEGEDELKFLFDDEKFVLSASYPKGYRGYYCMKYEVSQEQYVEFLNSLTLTQQKNRVDNNDFDNMVKGDYAFGDLKRPNCRNGIAFIMTKGAGTPAVFGNNLNPGNKFYSEDDGQTLACNYLSPADMLAYCDWSGLRPMTELEYEKACRRPYPQRPEKGEFGWNSNGGLNRIRSLNDLTSAGSERETPFDYRMNVNAGEGLNGPVRSGAFATNRTNQQEAGATYWGLMEMSGNLWEMCYNITAAGGKFVADHADYSHGDGYITDQGTDIVADYWPNTGAAIAVRGGSFATHDTLLRTSDRTYASGNYFSTFTTRDSSVGFRAARSILNISGFTAGKIYFSNGLEEDTVCSGINSQIEGNPAENVVGKVSYSWFLSEDQGISWRMVDGETKQTLSYEGVKNYTADFMNLLFKRKATCAVGEEFSNVVTAHIVTLVRKPELKNYELSAGIGYDLVLPAPLDTSFDSRWMFSSGAIHDGKNAVVHNYTAGDDGVYKLWNVDAYGCESEKVDVRVMGVEGIPIIDYGNYRAWADGTSAASGNKYRNPDSPYTYKGAIGDGVYRISPAGSSLPIDVFCDMTSYGGGWTLVWKAANNNYNTTSYTYDVGSIADWDFSSVGMAYLNPTTMERSDFTSMSSSQLVSDFKLQHPFMYGARDIPVTAVYDTYQQSGVVFKFGRQNFPQYIYQDWYDPTTLYGRIGIDWSQNSPYYSGYTTSGGDFCVRGHQIYSGQSCSNTRRFSLWVR